MAAAFALVSALLTRMKSDAHYNWGRNAAVVKRLSSQVSLLEADSSTRLLPRPWICAAGRRGALERTGRVFHHRARSGGRPGASGKALSPSRFAGLRKIYVRAPFARARNFAHRF